MSLTTFSAILTLKDASFLPTQQCNTRTGGASSTTWGYAWDFYSKGARCVGTRGSAGLSGGLVLVLDGGSYPSPGQAPGPRIHIPASPCPYDRQKSQRTLTTV